jgi:hypothetical protein
MKLAPIGPEANANTIGTVRVAWSIDGSAAPVVRMTSGASAINSAAYLGKFSELPAAKR